MGKGRQIAALVTENILRKRGRERVRFLWPLLIHRQQPHTVLVQACRLLLLLSLMVLSLQAHALCLN